MKRAVALRRFHVHRVARFEGEHGFVLGAVVAVESANVAPERDRPDKEEEDRDPDNAIHQVEDHLVAEHRMDAPQSGGRHERHELVHKDEEADRDEHVQRQHPAANLHFLLALLFGEAFERDVGGVAQGAEAERHRLSQRDHAANHRPAHPLVALRRARHRLRVHRHLPRRLAHRDSPGMRRAHHHALQHGLAAHERCLLAVFQGGEQLRGGKQAYELAQT